MLARVPVAPGLPPSVVLMDDGVILGLHDRIRGLLHKMAAMQREAQYQVSTHVSLTLLSTTSAVNRHRMYVCNMSWTG